MQKFVALAVCIGVVACSGDAPKGVATDTAVIIPGAPVAAARADTTTRWTLEENGAGAARVGLTLAELNADIHETLKMAAGDRAACQMLRSSKFPPGVSIMVLKDTIQRVDVDSAGVLTPDGFGVGTEEGVVVAALRKRLVIQRHKYDPNGHYLILPGTTDSVHRIIFETDGRQVTRMRGGVRPAVDQVEKCA